MSEADLQSDIIDALTRIGCLAVPNVVVLHRGRPTGLGTGSPDVFCAIPGHGSIFFEVKTIERSSKLSKGQVELHAHWRRFGVRIETIRDPREAVAVVTAIRFGRAA